MKESPNWLELPKDLIANILQRLDTVEKLTIAWKVCRTWRSICKDPAMWKVINIDLWQHGCGTSYKLDMLTTQALGLSCGELTDIRIGGYCSDRLIHHIALHSSKLKHLYLWDCYWMTGSGLSRAVKRLSQLEELEFSYIYITAEDIEVIGRNCPQLKSFLIFESNDWKHTGPYVKFDDQAVSIAKNMPRLRHLKICRAMMTNTGFEAILNGCPYLESLDIRMRRSYNLDENLVKKCTERIKDFKHNSNTKL